MWAITWVGVTYQQIVKSFATSVEPGYYGQYAHLYSLTGSTLLAASIQFFIQISL